MLIFNKLPTLALVEEPANVNPDLLLSTYHNARHIGYHAVKLNKRKCKQGRFESRSFLTSCLEGKITYKDLVLDLAPTTGISNWYFQISK